MTKTPAIIVAAYNRPESLKRALNSVARASYNGYCNITLVISIDGGGSNNILVREVANEFAWALGEKKIIAHKKNIGLREHILSCGDLTDVYENIILIEEDCYVSRNFYRFAEKALAFYNAENSIAGISLYAHSYYEAAAMPFQPLCDGYDVYFMQVPSSWGQAWTKEQWKRFRNYHNSSPKISLNDCIPETVKRWPESSWKKYFYKYMANNNLFIVYPHCSFSTNFGDEGTHETSATDLFQVNLENAINFAEYSFAPFPESCNKYDSYSEILPECLIALGADIDADTCVDLSGGKPLHLFKNKYAISAKDCTAGIRTFSARLLPPALNIIHNFNGSFFNYAQIKNFINFPKNKRYELVLKQNALAYLAGKHSVITGKYYKLGYYMLNPIKLVGYIYRLASGHKKQ
ncbi:MAG: glycosyltransferase family 2 protein [Bacteroidales bacterium]|nr:glycosyltransferase family 2 protein [Bacteroidales bacterium]